MKKNYIAPSTTCVVVKMESLLNPLSFNGQGGGGVTPQNGNATGTAMGRGGSDWDDED